MIWKILKVVATIEIVIGLWLTAIVSYWIWEALTGRAEQ